MKPAKANPVKPVSRLSIVFLLSVYGVFAIAGLVGLGSIFTKEGIRSDTNGIIFGFCWLFIFLYLIWLVVHTDRKRRLFEAWTTENSLALAQGNFRHELRELSGDSMVVQFPFVLSIGFHTAQLHSRYYHADTPWLELIGAWYAGHSLIFGWWALPAGPWYTLQAAYQCITGGHRSPIRDLLIC